MKSQHGGYGLKPVLSVLTFVIICACGRGIKPEQTCLDRFSNLTAWWDGESLSTTETRELVSNINASLQSTNGTLTFTSGLAGTGLSLSNSALLQAPHQDNYQFTDQFTVLGWVNSSSASGSNTSQALLSKWGYNTTFEASNFTVYNAATTSGMDTTGFEGAVFDGRYIYFVPYGLSAPYSGRVLRYDTHAGFGASSSWTAYDAGNTDGLTTKGYMGAAFDGRYIYFSPYSDGTSYHGRVLRYDTQSEFTVSSSWAAVNTQSLVHSLSYGFDTALYDGRYVYFVSAGVSSLLMVRYDTHGDFRTASSWANYTPSLVDGLYTRGYYGGTFDGRYMYFAPGHAGGSDYHGRVLRFDTTADFTAASSWSAYDAGNTSGLTTKGYYGGSVFDGRYVYFIPGYDGTSHHGRVLRYDTTSSFKDSSSWSAYDAGSTDGLSAKGFYGGVFDGRYIYAIPYHTTASLEHGIMLRYDTTAPFGTASSWKAIDAGSTGGQTTKGYVGGAFDGRYIYMAPFSTANTSTTHGRVLRYDTTGNNASFKLSYDGNGQYGYSGSAPGAEFIINTTSGPASIAAHQTFASGWHLVAGTYDGSTLSVYVDGSLVAQRAFTGSLVTNTENISLGAVSGGNSPIRGTLDELQLYNRALSAHEISLINTVGSGGICK